MRFYEHPDARCDYCGRQSITYGVKEEPTGWKVYCQCNKADCQTEWKTGWISREELDSIDDLYQSAEQLVR